MDLQAAYQALASGLLQFYPPGFQFQLKPGVYTRDELIQRFQQLIALAEATKTSNQAWRNAVQLEREFELQVRPLRQALRGIVSARYGNGGAEMMQFGFVPTKRGKKAAQTKADAVLKNKATRVARGTRGKNQKKAIKGIVATPPATPPSPAPAVPSQAPPAAVPPAPAAAPGANATHPPSAGQ